MIVAALLFLAVAVADLVAGGLQGIPASGRRAAVGVGAALLTSLAIGGFLLPLGTLAPLLAVELVGIGAWLGIRSIATLDSRRCWWALAALALYLITGVALSGSLPASPTPELDRWLVGLPFESLAALDGGRLLFDLALLVFAGATANAIVRAVLTVAGTRMRRSEKRLRGGRMIGVLERWLILGLMIHGEPTAAALVASAKSILRFPELSSVARQADDREGFRVDHVTEYFLLGSLTSWLVAIGLALLRG